MAVLLLNISLNLYKPYRSVFWSYEYGHQSKLFVKKLSYLFYRFYRKKKSIYRFQKSIYRFPVNTVTLGTTVLIGGTFLISGKNRFLLFLGQLEKEKNP